LPPGLLRLFSLPDWVAGILLILFLLAHEWLAFIIARAPAPAPLGALLLCIVAVVLPIHRYVAWYISGFVVLLWLSTIGGDSSFLPQIRGHSWLVNWLYGWLQGLLPFLLLLFALGSRMGRDKRSGRVAANPVENAPTASLEGGKGVTENSAIDK
jgi:hypothetical protein